MTCPARPNARRAAALVVAVAAVSIAILGAASRPAAAQAVPITAEPSHHLALTTGDVRVFDVTAAPRASTLPHRHDYDYVFVTLGDADISSIPTDGPERHLVLPDGAVEYAAGGFIHTVTNHAATPFHNITIELLTPAKGVQHCQTDCALGGHCESAAPWKAVRELSADRWSVTRVTLQPGGCYAPPRDVHATLLVAVSAVTLDARREGGRAEPIAGPPGQLAWLAPEPMTAPRPVVHVGAPAPTIRNVGAGDASFLVLELR